MRQRLPILREHCQKRADYRAYIHHVASITFEPMGMSQPLCGDAR